MATLTVGGTRFRGIRLVIFDKDGTLMDVHAYWAGMVRMRAERVCERLGLGPVERDGIMSAMGVDLRTGRIRPDGPVGIKRREIVLRAGADYLIANGHPDRGELFAEVSMQVDGDSSARFHEIVRPLPGAAALLAALREAGCLAAVATTDLSSRARLAMAHLGFSGYISEIAGADTVRATKPAPDMVYHLLDRFGVAPDAAVMIGDAEPDVLCGRNAGLAGSIGVASGLCPRERLESLTPDVIGSLEDIGIGEDAAE